MNRTIRIVLYVLSILTVAGVFAAFIFSGGKNTAETSSTVMQETENVSKLEENIISTEEPEETENTKETENTEGVEETENTEQEEHAAAEKETTLIFTGDVLFANAFKAGYDAGGMNGVVAEDLLQELKEADILMINNEFPFSDRGEAMADKQFVFRCEPSYVKALTEMGVDIVSLANNHTLDYGKDALRDTFATLDEAGILYGGAGDTVERAQQIQIIEANGKKFGFLAVSRVVPTADWKVENSAPGLFSCYDETRLLDLIEEGKKQCDFLTVFPHWGTEYSEAPDENQKQIAQKCMEAGADLIVGSHTHCLEGIEYINGKPVFYSLGNFIFGQSIEQSAAVEVTVKEDGTASYRLLPVYAAGGVTQNMDEAAAGKLFSYMQQISFNAAVDEKGNITED
ncbi:MAG: CapA family protein [Clostridiales bacterium]|nr:CapA family protein [Clostridiales bacterium]